MYVIGNINFINSNFLEMIRHEMVKFNDNLYFVVRKYPEDIIKTDKIQELRELIGADIVLRQNGWLFYCEQIPEAEIVSE